jgi:hypothetical protein
MNQTHLDATPLNPYLRQAMLVARIDALLLFACSEGCGLGIFPGACFLIGSGFKGVKMNVG